ncbi:helix-turn-helix domain-containing protein [Dysgonomonas sp. GY617]|uniref:helix-turn-helix domain-containing protein n=1 Tax=Dysgonomonas sp. GY617 TaxID=2780420 RepID=UPI0018847F3D|nr:helix-turn-helix transcriptional regulator [Dysgonomonas sp. GY617]MBF0576444.1 helix-turn-helix transcriptional regulator [Dysgonomonas sp. GY617]
MKTDNAATKKKHQGRNVRRLRQALGIKQEVIASALNITQQAVSLYEQKQEIDDDTLVKIAQALNVSVELIKELEEDPANVYIENNTFENGSQVGAIVGVMGENTTIYNPIEKIIELSNEKTALYERLLQVEKEKTALLEELLKEKK